MLSGCNEELYIIDNDEVSTNTSINVMIPNFEYIDYERDNAIIPGEYIWYSMTSRGILFIPNNGILTVYNPETGSINTLCPDPLCSHQPYSGCPYGNCIFTGSVPIVHNDRLYYFVKDQYIDKDNIISEYKIYSTDITGQKIKKHYESNGNYIFGLTIAKDNAYFLEFKDEHYTLLKSVSLSTGAKKTISTDGYDDLVIVSFIYMNDKIYYMVDNGRLYSCDQDFNNISFEYDTKRAPTIYAMKDMDSIFWCMDNIIYQYDVNTKNCNKLVEVEESLRIFNMFVEDEGLFYQVFPARVSYTMTYSEYTDTISGFNTLYFIDPSSGSESSYPLPDSLYLEANAITVCNGLLISQTYIENENTKKLAGRPYYAYELSTGSLYLITEVKGY